MSVYHFLQRAKEMTVMVKVKFFGHKIDAFLLNWQSGLWFVGILLLTMECRLWTVWIQIPLRFAINRRGNILKVNRRDRLKIGRSFVSLDGFDITPSSEQKTHFELLLTQSQLTFFDGIFQKKKSRIYCFSEKKSHRYPQNVSHIHPCDQTKRTMTLGNQVIYLMTWWFIPRSKKSFWWFSDNTGKRTHTTFIWMISETYWHIPTEINAWKKVASKRALSPSILWFFFFCRFTSRWLSTSEW